MAQATMTRSIAEQVSRHRRAQKLSAQALADRLGEVGLSWDRYTVQNLESGRRRHLEVGEVVALAAALDLPPILLLYPLGDREEVELLPGQTVSTWDAARWFMGLGPRPGNEDTWIKGATPVSLFHEHDRLVAEYGRLPAVVSGGSEEEANVRAEDKIRRMVEIEVGLRHVRTSMRRVGISPPPLPALLAGRIGEPDAAAADTGA